MTDPLVVSPILWGDGAHNDSATIRGLLTGESAFDNRTQRVIEAPTLKDMPVGFYCVTDDHTPPPAFLIYAEPFGPN